MARAAKSAAGAWKAALPDQAQRRQIKLEVLVREAAHAFGKAGYHGTSLDTIASNLGLTKPALYYYIKDKRDLLYRCHELAMDASLAGLELSARTGRNGREKTVLALRHYLMWLIGHHGAAVVLLEEGAMRPADRARIVKRRDEFERRLRAFVEEGIADGSIVPCSPKLVIFAAMGMVNWVQKWFEPGQAWSGAQVAHAITEMLERALSSTPAAAMTTDPRQLPVEPAAARAG
jgi:TetR/AcrR family transcriptional regulator